MTFDYPLFPVPEAASRTCIDIMFYFSLYSTMLKVYPIALEYKHLWHTLILSFVKALGK